MSGRAAVRTAFIVLITAWAVIWLAGDLLLPWHPYATLGFSADPGGRVTSVDAIAVREGLHVGDQILIKNLTPAERLRASAFTIAPEGQRLRLPLSNGRAVIVVSHVHLRSTIDNVTDILATLVVIAYAILAACLVLMRPTPATWAFYSFSYFFLFHGALVFQYISFPLWFAAAALSNVASAASSIAFISFALRFPDQVPAGLARRAERALLFVVGPALAIFFTAVFCLQIFAAVRPPIWYNDLNFVLMALFCAGIVMLLVRYANADLQNRNRLQWIVAAFALAFLPMIAVAFFDSWTSIVAPAWVLNCAAAWMVWAPLAVAYTILKHRLFDVRFIASRALIYTVLTSIVVGLFALLDWAFSRWLNASRFALVGELAVALMLGYAMSAVHGRVERFLNTIVFRSQTLALAALRRFSREIDLIADPSRLLAQTSEALRARLETAYAGIYTAEGASFALGTPIESDALPGILPSDDFAVLRLRRWNEPFECDEPRHPLRGALFVPMTARNQLVGFIVCGPKTDGTHYLPDEIETLTLLAHHAASAYAWLTMRPGEALALR